LHIKSTDNYIREIIFMETKKNNNTKKVKSISGSIIAAVCIVIYLFAIIQGVLRIYLSIDQLKITAEQEFIYISNLALSAGTRGFMDNNFIQTMNNALVSTKSLEALIITGADTGYAFEKQSGHAIAWVNNSPRFINRFSFSNHDYYRPLPVPDIRNANIKAIASAFSYNEITRILRETLLIILIGFALAFFTMIIQLLTGNKPEKNKLIDTPVPQSKVKTSPVNNETINRQSVSGSDPKGLYSSRSNIGWENYLNDRLDSELHRCSSTEMDLALVLAEFAEISNDAMYREMAQKAITFFSSRDLLFEYKSRGIAIILPGVNLETAINKLENFHQRIIGKSIYNKMQKSANSINIGISSRSGRLLNAGRMILEAAEALKKAKNDPKTSIIAFKSDPDKYRAFIASQN